MYILINGKFVEVQQQLVIAASSKKWGIKDNLRVEKGKLPFIDRYWSRANKAARYLHVRFPLFKHFSRDIFRLVALNKLRNGSLRFFAWKDLSTGSMHFLARTEAFYRHYPQSLLRRGMKVAVSSRRLDAGDVFHRFKMMRHPDPSKNFFDKEYERAFSEGWDEVLFLEDRGSVAECSRSNIFFVSGKKVFTPSLDSGCFPGVTRDIVLGLLKARRIHCRQGRFTLKDVLKAEEVFLTNSSMKVLPVSRIGDARIPTVSHGCVWKMLRNDFIRSEDEDRNVQH